LASATACGDDAPTGNNGAGEDAGPREDGGDDTGERDAAPDIGGAETTVDIGSDITVGDDSSEDVPSGADTGNPAEGRGCVPNTSEEEVCNDGLDNDCDGEIDETCGCGSADQPCWGGDPAAARGGDAICRNGRQECVQEFWGPCEGVIYPDDEEDCDTPEDDNCNGIVNGPEECPEVPDPVAACPDDFSGPVLNFYDLAGGYDDPLDTPMAAAVWSVRENPPGFSFDVEVLSGDGLDMRFFADVLGRYVFELTVTNTTGRTDTCETVFNAMTEDLLRIELFWNPDWDDETGEPDRSDVDLYLHRAATGTYTYSGDNDSCHWRNCATCREPYDDDREHERTCRTFISTDRPEGCTDLWPRPDLHWNAGGVESTRDCERDGDDNDVCPPDCEFDLSDDPRLDLDDVEGHGPENINVRAPAAGTYRVGVHYFYPDGFGDSTVYVRILCNGEELHSTAGVIMHGGRLGRQWRTNDFWEVGDIVIDYDVDDVCVFHPIGTDDCHRICPLNEADDSGCAPEDCE
jgi:hypothetical protein